MVPILKLQKGDTINGQKIKQEGRFAQNYQKKQADAKYNRWQSRQEIRNGKPNGSAGVMSGTDPLGSFLLSSILLSPIFKIGKPVLKLAKSVSTKAPNYGTRTVIGIDGKKYLIDKSVSEDALNSYITDSMIYGPESRTVPSKYLLEQNTLRELSWAPEPTQKSLTQILTTGKTSDAGALMRVPFGQRQQAIKAYSRALKAEEAVKNPKVTTVKNMQSMSQKEMKAHKYKPVAMDGAHTSTGSYVNDLYNSFNTMMHEATHGYQDFLPYTKAQKQLLKDTYLLPKKVKFKESISPDEMGATNAEFRMKIANKLGTPSYEQLNNYIKGMTDEEIYNLFTNYKPNGYITDYVRGIQQLKPNQIPQWANNFRLAQIKVPATVGYLITRRNNE